MPPTHALLQLGPAPRLFSQLPDGELPAAHLGASLTDLSDEQLRVLQRRLASETPDELSGNMHTLAGVEWELARAGA